MGAGRVQGHVQHGPTNITRLEHCGNGNGNSARAHQRLCLLRHQACIADPIRIPDTIQIGKKSPNPRTLETTE